MKKPRIQRKHAIRLTEVIPLIIAALSLASLLYFSIDFKPFLLMIIIAAAYFVTVEVHNRRQEYYHCPNCGYILPKKNAKVSGYDSEHTIRHVHCPKCGKIIG